VVATGPVSMSYVFVVAMWMCSMGVTVAGEPTEILSVACSDGEFTALDFDKSGKFIACGTSAGNVLLIDVSHGKTIRKLEGNGSPVTAISCQCSKDHLMAADEVGTILQWRMDSWVRQTDIPTTIKRPQKIFVDGTGNVFAVGVSNSIVQRSQGNQGTERVLFGERPASYPVFAVSPDLSLLVDGGSGVEVRFWDFKTGKFLKAMRNPHGSTSTICFSPDGSELVVGSFSPELSQTKVAVEEWQTIGWYGDETESLHLAQFSPDGKKLIVSPNGFGIELFENQPLRRVSTFAKSSIHQAAFAPSSDRIAISDGKRLEVWLVQD
jgi:eukaryotic-like serine/threonine-protein kinase